MPENENCMKKIVEDAERRYLRAREQSSERFAESLKESAAVGLDVLDFCGTLYFADLNIAVQTMCKNHIIGTGLFLTGICITELENAMRRGKGCRMLTLETTDKEVLENKLTASGLDTIEKIYAAMRDNVEIAGTVCQAEYMMGLRVYSPYAIVKPIAAPKTWTPSHVWKAILSGQISRGEIVGNYYFEDWARSKMFDGWKDVSLTQEQLRQLAVYYLERQYFPRFLHIRVKSSSESEIVLSISDGAGTGASKRYQLYFIPGV